MYSCAGWLYISNSKVKHVILTQMQKVLTTRMPHGSLWEFDSTKESIDKQFNIYCVANNIHDNAPR